MGEMKVTSKVCWENLTVSVYLEDLRVDWRIAIKWIFKKQGGIDVTDAAQDENRWLAFVNTVIQLRVA